MPTSGDIAVLQYGNDAKWHWQFLTPSVLSTLSFNSVTNPSLVVAVTWSNLSGKPTLSTVATSGSYDDLSSKPTIGAVMTADTGWTANNTAGDKTVALSSYSNGLSGTMVTALNLAAANTGTTLSAALDIVVLVVKQVAAIKTALVALKLPNA